MIIELFSLANNDLYFPLISNISIENIFKTEIQSLYNFTQIVRGVWENII